MILKFSPNMKKGAFSHNVYQRPAVAAMMAHLRRRSIAPRVVKWKIRRTDTAEMVEDSLIGFYFPPEMEKEISDECVSLGLEFVVIEYDPVRDHAADKTCIDDRYVVVQWMPPVEESVGIVDTNDNEFVVLFDIRKLLVVDESLLAEIISTLQFAASEMNRLHAAMISLMKNTTVI